MNMFEGNCVVCKVQVLTVPHVSYTIHGMLWCCAGYFIILLISNAQQNVKI